MKVLVPNSWSDVTVEEFQQIAALKADSTPSERLADMISILCGVDSLQMDTDTIKEIQSNLSFLNKEICNERFISFKHEGVDYEWIRSLNEITLGEQISIEQAIESEELDFSQSFDLIMAVLLTPKGDKFNALKINENRELFSRFPIDKVHGMILFFLSGGRISSKPMKEFLVVLKRKKIETVGLMKRESLMKRLIKKMLVTVLSGLQWLTGWLKMTLRSMK